MKNKEAEWRYKKSGKEKAKGERKMENRFPRRE
jgi:hypothetical protein